METITKEIAKVEAIKNETAIELTTWKQLHSRVWKKAARKAAIAFVDEVNNEVGTAIEVSSELISALAETCTASNKTKQVQALINCFTECAKEGGSDESKFIAYQNTIKEERKEERRTDKALNALAEMSDDEILAMLAQVRAKKASKE